jgi:hypothetical protein
MRIIDVITLTEELDIRPSTILGADGKPQSWHVFDTEAKRSIQTFTGKDAEGKAEEFRDRERAKRNMKPRSERESGKRAEKVKAARAERKAQLGKGIRSFINWVDGWLIRTGTFSLPEKDKGVKYKLGRITGTTFGILKKAGLIVLAQRYLADLEVLQKCRDLPEDSIAYDEMHLTKEEYDYCVRLLNAEYVVTIAASSGMSMIIEGAINLIRLVRGRIMLGSIPLGAFSFGIGTAITWGLTLAGTYAVTAALNSDTGKALLARWILSLMTPDEVVDDFWEDLRSLFARILPGLGADSWKPADGQRPGDRKPSGALVDIGKNLSNDALASRIKAVQLKITTAEDAGEKEHWNNVLTQLRAEQLRRQTQISNQPIPGSDEKQSSPTSNANMPQRDFDRQTRDMLQQLNNLPD